MITLILYYIVLLFSTFLIARNAYKMWAINHDFTLPIITFFMYYFTLAGALIFPLDAYFGFNGEAIGLHYLHIFDRLFKVAFDGDYILSVFYYVLFILTFQYTYLIAVKKYIIPFHRNQVTTPKSSYELILNPLIVLLITVFFIGVSVFILRDEIFYAISHEKSIYIITRGTTSKYYTIHQLANEFCVIVPFIAFSFTLVKSNRFNIKVERQRYAVFLLLFACTLAAVYIAILGNRRETLSGIVICILVGINQYRNLYYKRFAFVFLMVLTLFLANDFLRSTVIPRQLHLMFPSSSETKAPPMKATEEFFTSDKNTAADKGKQVLWSFLWSNELFYAHFSMYGILHHHVPITYGSSFVNLATSVVPRAVYPNRPLDIYNYYAQSVKAAKGQIYTIHHAAAWYLNFGVLGLLLGAVVLAMVFVFSFYISVASFKMDNFFFMLLKYLLPFLLCAQIVTFITAGPEGYKSLVLEGVLIPVLLLMLCFKKVKINTQNL